MTRWWLEIVVGTGATVDAGQLGDGSQLWERESEGSKSYQRIKFSRV